LHKPDSVLLRRLGRGHKLADGLQDAGDGLVVGGECLAQFDEGAHDIQAHFYRARRVEDGSCHQRPVLGESERHRRGKLEPMEVVANCDHLVASGAAELEGKIGGKTHGIALDLLVQPLGGYAVKRGEVGSDHDLAAADEENLPGDARGNDDCRRFNLLRDDDLPLPVARVGRNSVSVLR
jgi:hypothetical protein